MSKNELEPKYMMYQAVRDLIFVEHQKKILNNDDLLPCFDIILVEILSRSVERILKVHLCEIKKITLRKVKKYSHKIDEIFEEIVKEDKYLLFYASYALSDYYPQIAAKDFPLKTQVPKNIKKKDIKGTASLWFFFDVLKNAFKEARYPSDSFEFNYDVDGEWRDAFYHAYTIDRVIEFIALVVVRMPNSNMYYKYLIEVFRFEAEAYELNTKKHQRNHTEALKLISELYGE